MNSIKAGINQNLKFIFIVGPTASGKSRLALELALEFSGSIINIDSIQCYNDLFIGSASPSNEDKLKCPHYLYNYVKASNEITAGQYVRDFYKLIETTALKSPVFIVGGTGFYIQALEKGMYAIPEVDESIKKTIIEEYQKSGIDQLWNELITFDPTTTLHKNDHYRICRALEIKRAFNKKMSEFKNHERENKDKFKFPYLKIALTYENNQKEIYANIIKQRSEIMIKNGLITETQNLLNSGLEDWAPLSSVGYFQVCQWILKNKKNQKYNEEELINDISIATMQLVRKQRIWFKRDQKCHWFNIFNLDTQFMKQSISNFLQN